MSTNNRSKSLGAPSTSLSAIALVATLDSLLRIGRCTKLSDISRGKADVPCIGPSAVEGSLAHAYPARCTKQAALIRKPAAHDHFR